MNTPLSIIALLLGVVAGICVLVVLFATKWTNPGPDRRRHVLPSVPTLALPAGKPPLADESDEQEMGTLEPVLSIAASCPLPISSAFNNMLILEEGRPGRTIATRLFAERLGQLGIPQFIVTRNATYTSLLPFMSNGWLSGYAGAQEQCCAHLQRYAGQQAGRERFAEVDLHNAHRVGRKMLEAGAQVIFDAGTYPDQDCASHVLLHLLESIQEQQSPCVVMITEADRWLSSARRLPSSNATGGQVQLADVVSELMEMGMVYLSTENLMPMDLRLVRRCRLFLLNMVPREQDRLFILHHGGIGEAGLACLDETAAIICDLRTRTAQQVALYPHQSEEDWQDQPF